MAETQEDSCNIEEVNSAPSSEQSINVTHERNSRKSDSIEDIVTVRNGDKNCRDESASMRTNFDEDVNTSSSNVMFVSNSKDGTSSSWSRYQQKQLEWALVQYPKFTEERWEKIAKAVPGKSKVKIYLCPSHQLCDIIYYIL